MLYDILKIMKKMSTKNILFFILNKRNFSTSKISYYNNYEQCYALVKYEDKNFLKPILKVQDQLLAPIVFNENILNYVKHFQFILSRFPESNLVKLWLKNEFEQHNVVVNAKKNKGMDELLREIIKIKTETIEKNIISENLWSISQSYNEIKHNNLHYDNSCEGGLFAFRNAKIGLNEIINKETKKNPLYICCYIITFSNKYYYYIGSTTNIKDRFKTHSHNINSYIKMKKNTLNEYFKYFLDSEISYLKSKEGQKYALYFKISTLYLFPNYLNKFLSIYPNYRLSKGEWLLLDMINDLIIKTLEESLMIKFKPKLNIAKKVAFKHFEWDDEFLGIYSKSGKLIEYFKSKKYGIYLEPTRERLNSYEKLILNWTKKGYNTFELERDYNKIKNNEPIHIKTLSELCSRYKLNKEEVLNNLNRWHTYYGTILKNPLKIVEIT